MDQDMDQARFLDAIGRLAQEGHEARGIGTLGEKTLHAVLKSYLEEDLSCHEQRVGSYVADIVNKEGIVEIQTGGFDKLRKKLEALLPLSPVTLVYPVPGVKWLSWVDPKTGQVAKRRRSPKRGTPYQVFFELYKIKPYLSHPNLRLQVLVLELEEFRLLNGWSQDRKRGSTRHDRIPLSILGQVRVNGPGEYGKLVPQGMPEPFTSADYQAASGLTRAQAQRALNVLTYVSAVERVGKKGNAILYSY